MSEDSLDKVERTVGAVAKIIEVTKDSPEARQAASNLGKTAVTLTSALNNCLLPIAAINYGLDRARVYFQKQFGADLAEKTAKIAEENVIEPKPSMAGPILQGLAFSHDETTLKEMYLELLASTMNAQISVDAHPSFVEIIKQLQVEEAKLLSSLLKLNDVPIVEIRKIENVRRGWWGLMRHLLNTGNTDTHEVEVIPNLELWVNNWIRLGLCSVTYNQKLLGDNTYSWVESRPEFLQLKEQHTNEGCSVEFQPGTLNVTKLGKTFARVVGIEKEI